MQAPNRAGWKGHIQSFMCLIFTCTGIISTWFGICCSTNFVVSSVAHCPTFQKACPLSSLLSVLSLGILAGTQGSQSINSNITEFYRDKGGKRCKTDWPLEQPSALVPFPGWKAHSLSPIPPCPPSLLTFSSLPLHLFISTINNWEAACMCTSSLGPWHFPVLSCLF